MGYIVIHTHTQRKIKHMDNHTYTDLNNQTVFSISPSMALKYIQDVLVVCRICFWRDTVRQRPLVVPGTLDVCSAAVGLRLGPVNFASDRRTIKVERRRVPIHGDFKFGLLAVCYLLDTYMHSSLHVRACVCVCLCVSNCCPILWF